MCRALLYLGQPIPLETLLFKPDNSLVNQALLPQKLHMMNLGGFGVMAWDEHSPKPDVPYRYVTPSLPIFDKNLKALAVKLTPNCVLSHVRGVAYSAASQVSELNTHPFCYNNCKIALAHNGDLYQIDRIKQDLLRHIRPEFSQQICGTTDSEWIYALILSQLDDPSELQDGTEIVQAVRQSIAIIKDIRTERQIDISSSLNLFLATGKSVLGVRYCFNFGCYGTERPDQVHEANLSFLSLWYTTGRDFGLHDGEWKMVGAEDGATSLLIASEPLTKDTTSWAEVPEYCAVLGSLMDGKPMIEVFPLDV